MNINALDNNQETALSNALSLPMIKLLLMKGANPSIKNKYGLSFYNQYMEPVDSINMQNSDRYSVKLAREIKRLLLRSQDWSYGLNSEKKSWKAAFFNSCVREDTEENTPTLKV